MEVMDNFKKLMYRLLVLYLVGVAFWLALSVPAESRHLQATGQPYNMVIKDVYEWRYTTDKNSVEKCQIIYEENKTNSEVKEFCEVNFDINFPLTTISEVKGSNAHEIFKWAQNNFGKSAVPKWNFHKILINKEGKVENTYNSFTKPTSKKIISDIEKILEIDS